MHLGLGSFTLAMPERILVTGVLKCRIVSATRTGSFQRNMRRESSGTCRNMRGRRMRTCDLHSCECVSISASLSALSSTFRNRALLIRAVARLSPTSSLVPVVRAHRVRAGRECRICRERTRSELFSHTPPLGETDPLGRSPFFSAFTSSTRRSLRSPLIPR